MQRRLPMVLVACFLAAAFALGTILVLDLIDESAVAVEEAPRATSVPTEASAPAIELTAEDAPVETQEPPAAPAPTRAAIEAAPVEPSIPDNELAEALWVEGRVVFPSGAPFDERIEIIADGRRFSSKQHHRAVVAPDGSFRVAFEKRTKNGWLELNGRYAYLDQPRKIDPRTETKDVELTPKLGACLRGRLQPAPALLGEEARFAGTKVQVVTDWQQDSETIQREGRVGAQLEFEIGGIPAGLGFRLTASPSKAARIAQRCQAIEAGTLETIDVELLPGITVRGQVTDEAGAAVAGAGLQTVRRATGNPYPDLWDYSEKSASSTADGGFEITGVPAGDWVVHARKDGFVNASAELGEMADGAVREGLTLILRRGRAISGRVEYTDGNPAASANVWYRSLARHNAATVETAEDGTFTITGLEEGPYQVSAQARMPVAGTTSEKPDSLLEKARRNRGARVEAVAEKVEVGTSALVLVLREGSSLSGRVTDMAGKPFERFEVSAARVDHERPFLSNRTDGRSSKGIIDSDGRFVLTGLRDGEWDVSADAHDAVKSLPQRVHIPYEGAPIEIRLVRAASLSGTVVDPAGQPVAGARLTLAGVQPGQRTSSSGRLESDAEGRFQIDDVTPGPIRISASAKGWANSEPFALELAPEQAVAGITLALRPGGRLTGEVLDDAGRPASGRRVMLRPQTPNVRHPGPVETDAAGRFEIAVLTPGSYTVTTMPSEEELLALNATKERPAWESMFSRMKTARVEVVEGATAHVVIGAPAGSPIRVHGTVRSAGDAVADVSITAAPADASTGNRSPRRARSDDRGNYELTLDEPGSYHFELERSQRGVETTRLETIPESESYELDFQLPASRIAGRVLGPDGAPLGDVGISLQPDKSSSGGASSSGSQDTQEDGTFAFTDVAPGSYRLQAGRIASGTLPGQGGGHAIAVREGLVIGEDTRIEGIELTLSASCLVEGVVITSDGSPAIGASIIARDEKGTALVHDRYIGTDSAGRFRIDGLPTGRVTFFARTEAHASDESAPIATSPGETASVELRLRAATRLYVLVEGSDGKQVSAYTRVLDHRGRDCAGFLARPTGLTAAANDELPGQYCSTLPPGRYRVVATSHQGASASGTIELSGEPTASVTLRFTP